ncbi:MAG: hypothetical protein UY63_C0005G0079 [Parcubacteria group bacterium GW2011_GWA2_51_10]|nr:MAG: hypothetical protein UY63_C0005G0079 [Parcubacteria group bacterium GW2011_GWA2_51_10]
MSHKQGRHVYPRSIEARYFAGRHPGFYLEGKAPSGAANLLASLPRSLPAQAGKLRGYSASNKGFTTIELIVIAAILSAIAFLLLQLGSQPRSDGPVACTMEAKQCPDGSFVGRTGPKCEFAECPSAANSDTSDSVARGTLSGTITIGPICPVETDPPDPRCKPSPEAYAARTIYVYDQNRERLIRTLSPNAQGGFSTLLPVGRYVIDVDHPPVGGATGAPITVDIGKGETVTIHIDFDTGIR